MYVSLFMCVQVPSEARRENPSLEVTGIWESPDVGSGNQLLFSVRALHNLNYRAISPDLWPLS